MKTSLGQRERRIVKFDRIELRAAADGSKILDGHAAVFNVASPPHWGFTESIAPGAFTRAIQEDDVRGLFNHNPDLILGRNTSKTMTLAEDQTGLAFSIALPDTQCARDLAVSVSRGDISGCSFSFSVDDEGSELWDYAADGSAHRTIISASLYDVGPVTFPAYPTTDVSVRSIEAVLAEGKRLLEKRAAAAGLDPAVMRRKLDLAAVS